LRLCDSRQVPSVLREWLRLEGAAVCEIQVEDDQTWVPKPLEDMSPFLDRKNLQEKMIIELPQKN
jgi:hypothetical protein